ncbi:MAG: DUF4189 domain-containing protein [Legionella sp.]|nr:DUF4189 domain-containing protein [Legionella sp.]
MKNIFSKISLLSALFLVAWGISDSAFSDSAIKIDTTLTDQYALDNVGPAKKVFAKDTPKIYVIWQSDQLKAGQKIKSVWIADDTHNAAPANYKIDEAEFTLEAGMKGQILSHLPGGYWDGKFTISKPNNDWPLGTYHVAIYVDSQLVKTIPFSIDGDTHLAKVTTATPEKRKDSSWGALAVDEKSKGEEVAYGIGGGYSKEEAEKNALKYCAESEGAECGVALTYKECGAFASTKDHQGVGIGATKKIAEDAAKSACHDSNCAIIVSDCN